MQLAKTNEVVLYFENLNFGFVCPVKYLEVISGLIYHASSGKAKSLISSKLLNRVKVSIFGFRILHGSGY